MISTYVYVWLCVGFVSVRMMKGVIKSMWFPVCTLAWVWVLGLCLHLQCDKYIASVNFCVHSPGVNQQGLYTDQDTKWTHRVHVRASVCDSIDSTVYLMACVCLRSIISGGACAGGPWGDCVQEIRVIHLCLNVCVFVCVFKSMFVLRRHVYPCLVRAHASIWIGLLINVHVVTYLCVFIAVGVGTSGH